MSKSFELLCATGFISAAEQDELRGIALAYWQQGVLESNAKGPHRYRAKIWGTEHCTPFIKQLGGRIIEFFGLQGCPVDPQLGWIISLIEKGGQVHPHYDKYPYHDEHNAKHLRCNIMVDKENASGNPVIEGEIVDVPERAVWGFFPSEAQHATQLVDVERPRIVFQFGFVVPNDYQLPH
ncbi:hypothetical protein [Dasania marina]|uniref:hypothetical protein n=1 Tax=Dasania marina TaxID=471499 RepID=UPI0030DD47BC|tara:strand:+ start:15993 stop:16532 length:540 start_codon:yes stop_codon:yes gene_type:complete